MESLNSMKDFGYIPGTVPMYSSAARSIEDLESMIPDVNEKAEWSIHSNALREDQIPRVKYVLYAHNLSQAEYDEKIKKLGALKKKFEDVGGELEVIISGKPKTSGSGEPEGCEPGLS